MINQGEIVADLRPDQLAAPRCPRAGVAEHDQAALQVLVAELARPFLIGQAGRRLMVVSHQRRLMSPRPLGGRVGGVRAVVSKIRSHRVAQCLTGTTERGWSPSAPQLGRPPR